LLIAGAVSLFRTLIEEEIKVGVMSKFSEGGGI